MSKSVILLKAESSSKGVDPYRKALEEAGFIPHFIEVLNFKFVNSVQLAEQLQRHEEYSGMVVTSQTVVSAIEKAIAEGLISKEVFSSGWCSKKVYVVGASTAVAASKLGLQCFGEDSGNSESLAKYILSDIGSDGSSQHLLFPCGNLRKDSLPVMMKTANVRLTEIVCYETCPAEGIRENLSLYHQQNGPPDWIVFYSPSGVRFTTQTGYELQSGTKLAAIGNTTAVAMETEGLNVTACPSAPKPYNLTQVLLNT